jgi:DNA replication factor GINS
MDLDELRGVRRTERQKDSLQHLRDSFYEDVADYIAERKAERQRAAEAADDPFGDPQVGELTDEIETAEDVVEAIYERRVGKVVKLASFAAADMSTDTAGLTAEERALFDDLVARIKQNRSAVLDVLSGEGAESAEPEATVTADGDHGTADGAPTPPPISEESAESETSPEDVLAAAMGEEATGFEPDGGSESASGEPNPVPDVPSEPSPSGAPKPTADAPVADASESSDTDPPVVEANGETAAEPDRSASQVDAQADQGVGGTAATSRARGDRTADDPDRVTLRITEDVGRILAVDDREYDLAAEDVVTLPSTNAGPLMDRDAAERLD